MLLNINQLYFAHKHIEIIKGNCEHERIFIEYDYNWHHWPYYLKNITDDSELQQQLKCTLQTMHNNKRNNEKIIEKENLH